ncbi:transposase [Bordetella petrii]|nr:transposase [Bordetella petrii]
MVSGQAAEYDSPWAATVEIAAKIGCTAETLRRWVLQSEQDLDQGEDGAADEQGRLKALEREVRELRQANEILRKASAYFAQAKFDRPLKR